MKHGWHHGTQWNTVQIYSSVLKAVWYFERGQLRDQQTFTLLRSVVIFFSFVHPCLPLYLLFFFEGAVSRGYTASLAQIGELARRLYWVKRANYGASAMEEANRAEDWGGPTILSPLPFSVILRSAYYWPFFPLKKPCPRLTVIKNGQDLIDQKQAPCSCLDSSLASVLQRFCFASLPQVVCRNIRHFPTSWVQFPSACYAGHLDVNRKRAMLCMTKYRGWGEGRRKNTRHNEINDKGYQTTVKLD